MFKPHTDIKTNGLIALLPEFMRPYALLMRLDRPIGIWLLLLPALWAIVAASPQLNWFIITIFTIGAVIMRAAGCVINDLWDKDLDKAVERTKTRPIAAGDISIKHAIIFLISLLFIGLIILLQLNSIAQIIGLLSIMPVILYPLAKRVTWYPQLILGFTFNIGAIMGWAAITGEISPAAIAIYIAGIFWTLGYDTIYAHQDVHDDGIVGIKSTARKFGKNSKYFVATFYAATIAALYYSGTLINAGALFFVIWTLVAIHFIWQIYTWQIEDAQSCLKKFRSNRDVGLLVLFAFLINCLVL